MSAHNLFNSLQSFDLAGGSPGPEEHSGTEASCDPAADNQSGDLPPDHDATQWIIFLLPP